MDFLVLLHDLLEGACATRNGEFVEKVRQTDILDLKEIPAGSDTERTGEVGFTCTGCAENDDVVQFRMYWQAESLVMRGLSSFLS